MLGKSMSLKVSAEGELRRIRTYAQRAGGQLPLDSGPCLRLTEQTFAIGPSIYSAGFVVRKWMFVVAASREPRVGSFGRGGE